MEGLGFRATVNIRLTEGPLSADVSNNEPMSMSYLGDIDCS